MTELKQEKKELEKKIPETNIRLITSESYSEMFQLDADVFPEHSQGRFDYIINRPDGEIHGCWFGQKLIGYISFSPEVTEKSEPFIYVNSVCVDKDYRKMGFGSRLITLAINKALNYNIPVILHVRATNQPAVNMYIKHGLQIGGVIEKYYKDGDDAYIMLMYFGEN